MRGGGRRFGEAELGSSSPKLCSKLRCGFPELCSVPLVPLLNRMMLGELCQPVPSQSLLFLCPAARGESLRHGGQQVEQRSLAGVRVHQVQ